MPNEQPIFGPKYEFEINNFDKLLLQLVVEDIHKNIKRILSVEGDVTILSYKVTKSLIRGASSSKWKIDVEYNLGDENYTKSFFVKGIEQDEGTTDVFQQFRENSLINEIRCNLVLEAVREDIYGDAGAKEVIIPRLLQASAGNRNLGVISPNVSPEQVSQGKNYIYLVFEWHEGEAMRDFPQSVHEMLNALILASKMHDILYQKYGLVQADPAFSNILINGEKVVLVDWANCFYNGSAQVSNGNTEVSPSVLSEVIKPTGFVGTPERLTDDPKQIDLTFCKLLVYRNLAYQLISIFLKQNIVLSLVNPVKKEKNKYGMSLIDVDAMIKHIMAGNGGTVDQAEKSKAAKAKFTSIIETEFNTQFPSASPNTIGKQVADWLMEAIANKDPDKKLEDLARTFLSITSTIWKSNSNRA